MMSEKNRFNNPTKILNKTQVAEENYFRKLNYASTTFNKPYILHRYHALLFSTLCSNVSTLLSKIYLSKHYSYLCFSKHYLYCNSHPNLSSKASLCRSKGINPFFTFLNHYFPLSLINLKGTNTV